MRKISLIIILLLYFCSLNRQAKAQTDTTYIFKVVSPKLSITILPKSTDLYIGLKNLLRIRVSKGFIISRVLLDGGTITGKDSNYIAIVKEGLQAILSVYVTCPDSTEKLGLTKIFKIVSLPEPVIYINGVKNDSVIIKTKIIAVGRLSAKLPKIEKQLPIVSFDMIFANQDSLRMDTLHANNSALTKEMKTAISKMKEGRLLYFENIKCLLPDGSKYISKPMQIYLIDGPPLDKINIGD
jgi:hypothetical protein